MAFRWQKAWFQIIEVDHLPLTTFSRLPSLLLNAIGNIRQSFQYFPSTTPSFEEFLPSRPGSVSIPHLPWSATMVATMVSGSYTEPLTMALGVIISFLEFICSLEVLSRFALSLPIAASAQQQNRGMSVPTLGKVLSRA